MSEGLTLFTEREVKEGMGVVQVAFWRKDLDSFLRLLHIDDLEDISEEHMRMLCDLTSDESIIRAMEAQEARTPGSVELSLEGENGKESVVTSADVGLDLLLRLRPAPDEDHELALNPAYSPVRFELRIRYACSQALGGLILNHVLQPPDLT